MYREVKTDREREIANENEKERKRTIEKRIKERFIV